MATQILTEQESGVYRADLWQIVTDAKGFESIHETDEDGNPGDLVAHVFGDNAKKIIAAINRAAEPKVDHRLSDARQEVAPLREALELIEEMAPLEPTFGERWMAGVARGALGKARGEQP